MLRDCGLQSAVTRGSFLTAAKHVEGRARAAGMLHDVVAAYAVPLAAFAADVVGEGAGRPGAGREEGNRYADAPCCAK